MLKSIKSLALIISAAALLASCGNLPGSAAGKPTEGAAREATEPQAIQQHAQLVVDRIRGTLDEQRAGQFLIDYALNHPAQQCMTASGYTWDPPEIHVQSPIVIEPFGDSIWLREPMRPIASEDVLANTAYRRAEQEGRRIELSAEETATLEDCGTKTESQIPSDEALQKYDYPDVTRQLSAAFRDMMLQVDTKLGPAAEYTACMKQAGVDASDTLNLGVDGYAAVRLRMVNKEAPPPKDVPQEGEPSSDSWNAFLARERESLTADATCRSAQYQDGIQAIAPLLDRFESEHARDLEEADAHWSSVVTEARAKGFQPH
jgi:hypothetical protein